jgi:hypothetical protein
LTQNVEHKRPKRNSDTKARLHVSRKGDRLAKSNSRVACSSSETEDNCKLCCKSASSQVREVRQRCNCSSEASSDEDCEHDVTKISRDLPRNTKHQSIREIPRRSHAYVGHEGDRSGDFGNRNECRKSNSTWLPSNREIPSRKHVHLGHDGDRHGQVECDSNSKLRESAWQSSSREIPSSRSVHLGHDRDGTRCWLTDENTDRKQPYSRPDSAARCPEYSVPYIDSHQHYPSAPLGSDNGRSPRYVPSVKLEIYRGDSCLETFLAKFRNMASYLRWGEEDQLFHLRASLEGAAGQILWDAGSQTSVHSIIELLRARFGNENQAERFRAELKARRRRKGESLQTLYNDICRLLALAYPGPSNALMNLVGRDAFLDALDQSSLRIRILEKEPKTLEDALSLACRLEAYDRTANVSLEPSDNDAEYTHKRNRHVRTVAATTASTTSPSTTEVALNDLTKQMSDLCKIFANNGPRIANGGMALTTEKSSSTMEHPSSMCQFWGQPSAPQVNLSATLPDASAPWLSGHNSTNAQLTNNPIHSSVNSSESYGGRNKNRKNRCYSCGESGHWKRECPRKSSMPSQNNGDNARMGAISAQIRPAEIYVDASIEGKKVVCLLDTGCERSLIGRKLIPERFLTGTNTNLFAANGTPIPVIGTTCLEFLIDGIKVTANLLVTEVLEELILGIDWLSSNRCQWDFGAAKLQLSDHQIRVYKREARGMVRRVYVAESHILPAGHQEDLRVKMTWNRLNNPATDWVFEPKSLRHGVIVARTLLSNHSSSALVRVINYSDTDHRFVSDQCIGKAEPALAVDLEYDTENSSETSRDNCSAKVISSDDDKASLQVPKTDTEGNPIAWVNVDQVSKTDSCVNNDPTTGELSHIQCIFDALPPELTQEERQRAVVFIQKNASLFSKSEFDIGRTNLVQHRIDTGNNRPFKQALRRHPIAHLPTIDEHVKNMLANDIIEPAASAWASNVVLIQKKDGSLRFCVDYRKLNDLTYKDSYPLPRIDSCLHSLGGSKYFSTLDLRAGYWQTLIDPRDRDKTAFVTRRGVFRFKVLSFGLANAPALFQRLMDLILTGLTWEICLVFLDDTIVFSRTFEEHIERLTKVFNRLHEAGLKLKPSKCRLFQQRVTFLGNVVSAAGIEPDPEKIEAVRTWPRPRNLTEVRAFVGLSSYYRSHIRGFAEIARPLHELSKKNQCFQWTSRQEESFIQLKQCLTSAPVLSAPIDDGNYILDTDASNFALGAVLQQEQEGVLRVIAYASRCLSKAEQSYCTTRKELLGIVFGLQKFRQFLLARNFTLRTDHAALTHLRRTPEPLGQQARWLDLLSEFNFEIKHRVGTAHGNSDALSRRPCERDTNDKCLQCNRTLQRPGHIKRVVTRSQAAMTGETSNMTIMEDPIGSQQLTNIEEENKFESKPTVIKLEQVSKSRDLLESATEVITDTHKDPVLVLTESDNVFSSATVRQEQLKDPNICPILQWKSSSDDRPDWNAVAGKSDETRSYWAQWASLTVENGVLYRKFQSGERETLYLQLIVPENLRHEFVRQSHGGLTGGHFGIRRTQDQVCRRGYWVGWRNYVDRFCKRCPICSQVHRGKPPKQGKLKPLEANGPMDRLHVDLCGPFPRSKGYNYIMTCVDAYTRYLIAIPLRDKTATSIADALVTHVFCRIGLCRQLITDLGPEFQNEIFSHLCSLLHVRQLRTTSYRPNCNGKVERVHRSLNMMMAKVVATDQRDWSEKLSLCAMAYNASRHESTAHSPYFLMHGREAICPLDLLLDTPQQNFPLNVNEYADELVDRLKSAFRIVTEHQKSQVERMKRNYDVNIKTPSFKVGDMVWYYYPRRFSGRSPKWSRVYIGPYKITAALNDVNFVLKTSPRSKPFVVHIDKLRPFFGSTPQCWLKTNTEFYRSGDGNIQQGNPSDIPISNLQPSLRDQRTCALSQMATSECLNKMPKFDVQKQSTFASNSSTSTTISVVIKAIKVVFS